MVHDPYSFNGSPGYGHVLEPSGPTHDEFTSSVGNHDVLSSDGESIVRHNSLCPSEAGIHDQLLARKRMDEKDFARRQQRQAAKYLERFGDNHESAMRWEQLENGEIAFHHKKLLFSTALQCSNYVKKEGFDLANEAEGDDFLLYLAEECSKERSRLRQRQAEWTKEKKAMSQEMKMRVAQLKKANRQLGHEKMVTERRLAKLDMQLKLELEPLKARQQRTCEQLTRLVDIVARLPPFQPTFEKAPVSERLVIVMALGPYAVQSDTSGHVRAQFSKFAAANSADLLRLSLRCPLPGLMLQAAQLAKTQIEEFILNCHQASQKWNCICLVDEIFDLGASHMSVFDEVPENSVFITQPHLRKDHTRPTNALPSMLVFPTKHIKILENWRRAFLSNMMVDTAQSSSNEVTDSFASVLSNTCAEMGIQVHSVCKDLSSHKDTDSFTEGGSDMGSEEPISSDTGSQPSSRRCSRRMSMS